MTPALELLKTRPRYASLTAQAVQLLRVDKLMRDHGKNLHVQESLQPSINRHDLRMSYSRESEVQLAHKANDDLIPLESQDDQSVKRERKKSEPDTFEETLEEAERRKQGIVHTYVALLAAIVFGPLCPLMFLVAPIFAGASLCATSWIRTRAKPDTHLQRLADKVLVQQPTRIFSLSAVFTQWLVAAGVFYE